MFQNVQLIFQTLLYFKIQLGMGGSVTPIPQYVRKVGDILCKIGGALRV